MGLGMTHGRKCWLVYVPRLNRIFVTRNVQFDDTFFPMRANDQRVFGTYDNEAVTQMRAQAYGLQWMNQTPMEDVMRMPLKGDPANNNIDLEFDPLTDANYENCKCRVKRMRTCILR